MFKRAIAVSVLAVSLGGAAAVPASASTSPSACSTRVEHTYSVTSRGTQSWTYLDKRTCGRDYTEYEHRVTLSYTGAYSIEDLWKTEKPYPHWHSVEHLQSWSKTGTFSDKWVTRVG